MTWHVVITILSVYSGTPPTAGSQFTNVDTWVIGLTSAGDVGKVFTPKVTSRNMARSTARTVFPRKHHCSVSESFDFTTVAFDVHEKSLESF